MAHKKKNVITKIHGPYTSFCFCFVPVIHCKTQRLRIKWYKCYINLYHLTSQWLPRLAQFVLGSKFLSLVQTKILLCTKVTVFQKEVLCLHQGFLISKKEKTLIKKFSTSYSFCNTVCCFSNTVQKHTVNVLFVSVQKFLQIAMGLNY